MGIDPGTLGFEGQSLSKAHNSANSVLGRNPALSDIETQQDVHTFPLLAKQARLSSCLEYWIHTLYDKKQLLTSPQYICLLVLLFLWDGFGHHLLYNVMNLHP